MRGVTLLLGRSDAVAMVEWCCCYGYSSWIWTSNSSGSNNNRQVRKSLANRKILTSDITFAAFYLLVLQGLSLTRAQSDDLKWAWIPVCIIAPINGTVVAPQRTNGRDLSSADTRSMAPVRTWLEEDPGKTGGEGRATFTWSDGE